MSPTAWAAGIKSFIEAIGKEGAFAIGALFGALVMSLSFWLNSKERREMFKLIMDREKVLQQQLDTRDKRIIELHEQLGKLRKEKGK